MIKYNVIVALFLLVFGTVNGYLMGVGNTFAYPEWHYEHFIDKSIPYPFKRGEEMKIKKVAVRFKNGCAVDSTVCYYNGKED